MALHLLKLCVGCDTVEELLDWRAASASPGSPWILRTRQTPKRAAELLEAGSLYRVYKGLILSRQRILGVATIDDGPRARCEITLEETVTRVLPTPRRPFQGWRYLPAAEAPADLDGGVGLHAVPGELARRLRELGAW
jgi:hypothetical protein